MALLDFLSAVLGVLFAGLVLVAGYFVLATRRIAGDAERRVPPVGRFIEVDGNRLHYLDEGAGPPLLLLHGLGAQLMQFRQTLVPDLSRNFRVVALDRPGSGYSTMAPGFDGRLQQQAKVIAGFIEALGLERALVVGHSLGGTVALSLALDHPEKIAGLALLAPMTHLTSPPPAEFKALYMPSRLKRRLVAHTIAVPMALKYAGATLAYIFSPQTAPRDYMTAGGGSLGLRPSHFFATATDFTAIERDIGDIAARLPTLGLPVGVLFGDADRVLDHQLHGVALEGRIPGLDLEMLEGQGHMLPYGASNETAAFIRRMAATVFSPGAADGSAAQ